MRGAAMNARFSQLIAGSPVTVRRLFGGDISPATNIQYPTQVPRSRSPSAMSSPAERPDFGLSASDLLVTVRRRGEGRDTRNDAAEVSVPGASPAFLLTAVLLLCGHPGEMYAMPESGAACAPAEPPARYLVVFDPRTPAEHAANEIDTSCGELTTYYAEIAVGVATSADAHFAERLGEHRAFSAQRHRRGLPVPSPNTTSPRRLIPTEAAEDLTDRQWNLRAVRAEAAHVHQRGSADVVVGVLDSGIDTSHPELAHAVLPELSTNCLSGTPEPSRTDGEPPASAHGTHVAGILAAAADERGVTGVAPGVKVASVRVVDDHGRVSPEAAVCGLLWAAEQGFTLVNGSFLIEPWAKPCAREPGRAAVREAVRRALRHAHDEGTLTVVAASNKATELTPAGAPSDRAGCETLPAGLRDAVSVSASDRHGLKAGYSAYGLSVIDLTAPGGEPGDCVLSTVPGGYGTLCGTSMAAPHVTGVAALLASHHPGLPPDRLRDTLLHTASPVPCPDDYDLTGNGVQNAYCEGYAGYNGFYGHGMVDAYAAVNSVSTTQGGDTTSDAIDPEDG